MADDFEHQFFEELVREWAYAPELTLDDYSLDDYQLHHVQLLPLLFELIQDQACPKREPLLLILEDFTRRQALFKLAVGPEFVQAIAAGAASQDPDLQGWSSYARRVLQRYRAQPFTVKQAQAIEMGEDLLVGPRRLAHLRQATQTYDQLVFHTLSSRYWELSCPIMGPYHTYLYLKKATGDHIALFTIRLTAEKLDGLPWDRPLTPTEIQQLSKDKGESR